MHLWKFGGDRGYPGTIEPSSSPNLFLTRTPSPAAARGISPTAEAGLMIHPSSTYAIDPKLLRLIREEWYPTPANAFGLFVNSNIEAETETGKAYFKYVVMHEFGHAIGLGHPLKEGCTYQDSVMFTSLPGESYLPAPTEKDKTALRKLLGIQ
jgi:hypothetical protein